MIMILLTSLTDASTGVHLRIASRPNGVILLNGKEPVKLGKTKFTYKTQYGVAQRPSNNKLKRELQPKIDYELMVVDLPWKI